VSLVCADARILTIYTNHYDAYDLGSPYWRSGNRFNGTLDDARRILKEIASALAHLEEKGVQHNDIKPGNILYRRDTGSMLIDFSISTVKGIKPAGGTPYYLPPEALKNERGPTADVWALAIVLLYLMQAVPLPETMAGEYLAWQISEVALYSGEWREGQKRMREWIQRVMQERNKLRDPASVKVPKEIRELRSIVCHMLTSTPPLDESLSGSLVRIASTELANVTQHWAD
jgi:serine/threonine protein kinase